MNALTLITATVEPGRVNLEDYLDVFRSYRGSHRAGGYDWTVMGRPSGQDCSLRYLTNAGRQLHVEFIADSRGARVEFRVFPDASYHGRDAEPVTKTMARHRNNKSIEDWIHDSLTECVAWARGGQVHATVEPDSGDPRTAWVRTIARGLASLGTVKLEPRLDKFVVGHELRVGDLHLILNFDNRGEINMVTRYRNAWLCRTRVKSNADARGYSASLVELVAAIKRCQSAQELYDYSLEHRGYKDMLNGLSASHVKLLLPGKILDASGFPVTATVEPGQAINLQALKSAVERMSVVKHCVLGLGAGNEYIKVWFRDTHASALELKPGSGGLNAILLALGGEHAGVLRSISPAVIVERIDKLTKELGYQEGRTSTELVTLTRQAMQRFCR